MSKKTIVILAAVLAAALALFGQSAEELEKSLKKDPDNKQILYALGHLYHNQAGLNGQSGAAEKAEKYLRHLLEVDPGNSTGQAYLGSVLTIRAGNLGQNADALALLNEGFSIMDKAILLEPENPEARLVRAVNSLQVPEVFGRKSLILEDFKAIETFIAKSSRKLPPDFLLPYHFYYGTTLAAAGKAGEAEAHLKKVIEIAPDSPLAAQAKKQLSEKRRA